MALPARNFSPASAARGRPRRTPCAVERDPRPLPLLAHLLDREALLRERRLELTAGHDPRVPLEDDLVHAAEGRAAFGHSGSGPGGGDLPKLPRCAAMWLSRPSASKAQDTWCGGASMERKRPCSPRPSSSLRSLPRGEGSFARPESAPKPACTCSSTSLHSAPFQGSSSWTCSWAR